MLRTVTGVESYRGYMDFLIYLCRGRLTNKEMPVAFLCLKMVGVIYLEYINGIELGKSSIENFSAKERFSIIKQLLDAIEISHSNGIIHRDINPNNIMLTDDKQVKLIDFGICKINDMINSATV